MASKKLSSTLQKQFQEKNLSLNDSYQSISGPAKRPAPLYQKKRVRTNLKPVSLPLNICLIN